MKLISGLKNRINELANGFSHSLILSFASSLIFLLLVNGAAAQSISATLSSDSSKILIGDHLAVKLAIKHSRAMQVVLPPVADTLGNMEVISASKIDTATTDKEQVLTQNFTVSAFDSGMFHAGPVMVVYKMATGETDTLFSNIWEVNVLTLPVDTTKAIKPIKAPLEIPYSWKEFVPYIIAGWVLIASIVIAIILFIKLRKKKPVPVAKPRPKDPPHIWARNELKKLEQEKLWQKDEVKVYYSRLTDILRMYLEYRYNWQALESTTEEIEADLENYNLKEKAKESLLVILRTADLVKFAKLLPLPDINIRMMDSAYKFIDFTEPKENKEESK